jgi:hypothetical protein
MTQAPRVEDGNWVGLDGEDCPTEESDAAAVTLVCPEQRRTEEGGWKKFLIV